MTSTRKGANAHEETNFLNKLINLGQDRLTEVAGELLKNDKFVDALQNAFEKGLEVKGKLDKNTQFLLNMMNLPSKADYDNLNAKINALRKGIRELNEKIEEIADQFEEQSAAFAAVAEASKKTTTRKRSTSKAGSTTTRKATSKRGTTKSTTKGAKSSETPKKS
ncbi:MAG: hypothetical protein D6795_02860 [Deltaproteobacteria bacterium]|nr:MAG: hypothetical protein D6795_02860 [Deltaproteobacteria bacterium]